MSKKRIFGDKDVNKNTFHKRKQPVDKNKVDIDKIVISDKDSYGKKGSFAYFIGCKSNDGIRPLYIKLPQMSGHVKIYW